MESNSTEAKAQGREIIAEGPEPSSDPLVIKRGLDGALKNQPLTDGFKQALRDSYANDLGLNVEALAKATGISEGAINAALWEHPKTLAAARAKRKAATLDAAEQSLHLMVTRLRAALVSGEVTPTNKNLRDYSIALGILTDKLAILRGDGAAGGAVIALEVSETMDERKARLVAVLDKADHAIGLLSAIGKPGKTGTDGA